MSNLRLFARFLDPFAMKSVFVCLIGANFYCAKQRFAKISQKIWKNANCLRRFAWIVRFLMPMYVPKITEVLKSEENLLFLLLNLRKFSFQYFFKILIRVHNTNWNSKANNFPELSRRLTGFSTHPLGWSRSARII